jgi:DNA-directed RNA polymerase specialized sigma24 family protein
MDRGTAVLSPHDATVSALTAAYDLYAVGLYDYCSWALGDNQLAEDAVHNALVSAAGRGLLPGDPAGTEPVQAESLRAWIFAAGRNECVRLTALTRQAESGGPHAQPDTAGNGTGWRGLTQHRPSRDELVRMTQLRQVLDQLPADDEELAELSFRHGFGSAALAALLGCPQPAIRRSVARIYGRLSADCDDRVAATFAIAPFQGPPMALRARVIGTASVPARLAQLAERQAPFDRAGFPRPADRRRARPGVLLATGAGAAALLAFALLADTIFGGATSTHSTSALAEEVAQPALTEPVFSEPPLAPMPIPTAVPSPGPSARPAARARPAAVRPSRPPRIVPKPVPHPRITAQLSFQADAATKAWKVTVRALVTDAEATQVRIAVWWIDKDGKHRRDLGATRTGEHVYRVRVTGLKYAPIACAQARTSTRSGLVLLSPVTSPGGFGYCGSTRLGRK